VALYVPLATFRSLSVIPRADTDSIEASSPGFIEARSALHQSWLEGRLRKRYAVPFDPAAVPAVVTLWLVSLLTLDAYAKRGFNPDLPELKPMADAAQRALDEVKEAADSETGLFDLPLIDGSSSAVVNGGPRFYSETSPYVGLDIQRQIATSEDTFGRGTT